MRRSASIRIAATAIAAATCLPASAQSWPESGDAPETPHACAQGALGDGPLLSIVGVTDTGVDDFVDAFVIDITDVETFYATTSADYDPAAAAGWDTRLFLFDLAGNALLANDDAPGVPGAASYLSGPGAFPGAVDPGAPAIAAGPHVLVITGWANDPEDAVGIDLFALGSDFDALHGPDPAAGLFEHWENGHGLVMSGGYTIALAGAAFVDTTSCPPDVDCDGIVGVSDLIAVVLAWNADGGAEDVNGDGVVDVADLVAVILAWGPCA